MNRRQLLKSLGVLPIAGAIGCDRDDQKPKPGQKCHTLQILLEGAFAVVVRRQEQYRITAFSPASPTAPPPDGKCPKDLFPIERHEFCFNGKQQQPGNYHFELSLPEGPKPVPRPIIDIGFRDFTAATDEWRLANNFVSIDLPSPKTISFDGQPDLVMFKFPAGTQRTGNMPSNHILEYQVEDPSQIKMVCQGMKEGCVPTSTDDPNVSRFSFSVGLLPEKDNDGQHAVKFFNYLLCGFFPRLVAAYSLSSAGYGRPNPIDMPRGELHEPHGKLVPAVLNYRTAQPRMLTVSAAVDCKSGGIIVATDRAPMP